MAFKASKVRSVRQRGAEGRPIIPNEGLVVWYAKQLRPHVAAMVADYEKALAQDYQEDDVEEFMVGDRSISDLFQSTLDRLHKKWTGVFVRLGSKVSDEFIEKGAKAATAAADFSMSNAGVVAPRAQYSEHTRQSLGGYAKFNDTLITGIQANYHKRIYEAVMLSLTSPDETKQGQRGIVEALKEIGITEKKRVDLIARDQTSKLYGALSVNRMKESGVEYFRWSHTMGPKSERGRVNWRESHEALDGEVFSVDDPDLWRVGKYFSRKGDIGIPGYAINCRCRMIPIVLPSVQDLSSIEKRYGKAARIAFE